MSHASLDTYAHYGDCAIDTVDRLGPAGDRSAGDAVGVLRDALSRGAPSPSQDELDVIEWARRDLPELRSSSDRTTPEQLYRRIAESTVGESMFASGRRGAVQMGYGPELDLLDGWRLDRFVGLGCPWQVGLPEPGDRVLDLGSGAGVDLAIAAGRVGPAGAVLGIDRLPFLATAGPPAPGPVALGNANACPVRDGWATMVVANGLPPLLGARSAPSVLIEARRVLARGGALRFTTLVVGGDVPIDRMSGLEVVHAVRCSKPVCAQYRSALAAAGFESIEIRPAPPPFCEGYRAGPVRAALITARRA